MSASRLRVLLLVDAVYSVGVGLLLLAGTWDDLFEALELPQAKPALFAQVGGAVMWGVAYLLWMAARTPSLMLPVARASAIMNALSTGVLVAWLVNGELEIETLGKALLVASAALSAIFTALFLQAGLRRGGYGPEPPPPPHQG